MAYNIQQLPGRLILAYLSEPDGSIMLDLMRSVDKAMCLLDSAPEPCALVIDFRSVTMNLDDLLKVCSTLALGPHPVTHHPNVSETLFISADPSVRTAMAGLASPAFGEVRLAQFETLDEALAYCRDRLTRPDHALEAWSAN